MRFTVILLPEADGRYSVICPGLPGCASQGDSLAEAMANIREAIELTLEVRQEEDMPLPVETPSVIAEAIEMCLEGRVLDGLPLTLETRVVDIQAEVAA
jgi:antitoxin HicB